jgi:hypothetical protein
VWLSCLTILIDPVTRTPKAAARAAVGLAGVSDVGGVGLDGVGVHRGVARVADRVGREQDL